MKVHDVMTRDPAVCTPDEPLPEVARKMVECDCGEIPVVTSEAEGRPVGVVTDRDITCRTVAERRNPLELSARDAMTSPAVTVSENAPLEECVRIMEERQIRRVPVVDDRGCCCGMVSQADIARHASRRKTGELVRDVSEPSQRAAGSAARPV